ncbi:hypothetical protein EDD86DRAFT_110067 [Gorgonomyces haynaldii]|nr:hypothetical protein EDD86DRAFT_110067 [Gorgonomyces haynaldii]
MVVKLDHPRILVRHHATTLSLEQFSIRFWSKLGLTPMFGPKDVKWCALLPMLPQSQIRPTLTMYMDQMRHLWEMYGFGSLEPLQFGDRDHSLYPVSLQHKTPECLLESYLTVIPAVASQLGLLPRQFCVIYFWTPFTVSAQHVEDLSSIFHRLVGHLGQLLQLPVETLLEYVKMEIITMHEANALLLRPDPSKTFENAVMRLYNRFKIPLEPVSDFQSSGFLYAPSYLLESRIKSEITLTLDRMHLIHPLLVMEPDRVIYLFFGQRTDTVYAIWADATNEFLEQKWFSAPQNTASHLWDHTLRLFSQSEFKIRLVVVSVDGWTPGLLQDWNALSGPSIVPSPQPSEEELDIQTPLVTSLAMNPQPGSFKPGLPPPVVNTILSLSLVDVNLDASLDIIFPEPFQNTYPVQKWTHHQPNQLLFSLQHCRLPYSADKSLLSLSTCYLVQPEERETFASTWQISLLGHHNYSYLVQSCYPQWQQQAKDEHPSVPKQHHLAIVRDVAKQLQPMAAMEDFEWPYLECQRSLDFLSLFSSF